ncbi:MAG: type IV pilus assembly protein PilM [Verrucomicrobia bacterium]|nr:MAG: type IV pilus assembly protein PilM [Verrucomicrobiota bacterium]
MFKSERILALDVGASGLKLAEFVPLKSGGVELVRYAVGALDLDPHSDEDRHARITSTLQAMLAEAGVKPGPVLVSVAGQSVFSKFVKLPPTDREKIQQIVQFEAQQNVPFPIDEVVWDYQLIGPGVGELDVMLAAIKADIIQQLFACIEAAGLEPELVDVAPMALYNATRYNYGELPACALVVDMGARSTDLIFIEQGRVFNRSIPVAGNAITQQIMQEFTLSFADAEEMKKAHAFVAFGGAYEGHKSEVVDKVSKSVRSVMTRMHAEIVRSINFYRGQQSGEAPSLVLLAGGTSIISYTDTFLKEKLNIEVDYLNPFTNVAVNAAIPAEQIGRSAHVMGQVVGLALRRRMPCPIEINLLPPVKVAERAFRRKQPMFVMAMLGVILTVAVWAIYFSKMAQLAHARSQTLSAYVETLAAIETRLQGQESRVKSIQNKLDKLQNLARLRTQWLEMVDQIRACMPEGMVLVWLRPERAAGVASADEAENVGAPARASMRVAASVPEMRALEVKGFIYRDKLESAAAVGTPQPVAGANAPASAVIASTNETRKVEEQNLIRAFRDALREKPLFSNKTEVVSAPAPGEFAQEFEMRIVLKHPLRL